MNYSDCPWQKDVGHDFVSALAASASKAPISQHLITLLDREVVLLPCVKGTKGPRSEGWQNTTIEKMRDGSYLQTLDSAGNIAVLLGMASGGLCSIDIDDDEAVEPFLALNPRFRGTLRSRGKRGCNLWTRIQGGFPASTNIARRGGRAWGEWRANGNCTMIHGTHPDGMAYLRAPEVSPITVSFADIVWPEDLHLPWLSSDDEDLLNVDETDEQIIKAYGDPVYFSTARNGKVSVKVINQAYWAGLYAAENLVLYEPDERIFYRYDDGQGTYSEISSDLIKCVLSSRMLEVSRDVQSLSSLAAHRNKKNLDAAIDSLRGIVEQRKAFADRPSVLHFANCILARKDGQWFRQKFSPEFHSRNRSPIVYDPEVTCPRFLHELLLPAVKPEDAILLQKMAGQCLLGENRTQRFVILDGEAGRGKSQYGNVLQALVGQENITQLRTEHLNDRFELYRYLRRTLLVGVDVDARFLESRGAPVIKGLVGGDWYDAEQKGGTGSFLFQGKFNVLMTSNSRLKVNLQNDAGAWKRRMLIVRFEAPPPQKKIPNFADVLIKEEGSGILNWALHGLHLLLNDIDETGDIRLTKNQTSLVDSLLAESDSLQFFLDAHVVRLSGSDLTVSEIVDAYTRYCTERGWISTPEGQVQRQLPQLMREKFQASNTHNCKSGDKSVRGYRGVVFHNLSVLP